MAQSVTRHAAALLLLFVPTGIMAAQGTSVPSLHFDIYTVKPSKADMQGMSMGWHDNTFIATHVTLKFMLQVAYNIRQASIEQLPHWADSDFYDIQGKVSEFDPDVFKKMSPEQRRAMQQDFLAHAFGVQVHHETRIQPTYELVVGKGGVKMPVNTIDPASPEAKGKVGSMSMNGERLDAQGISIEVITKALEGVVERDIVDKTTLTGRYDVALRWRRQGALDRQDDDAPPDIFTAVQEQLGLKLQPTKAPADILVVDSVHMPEEN